MTRQIREGIVTTGFSATMAAVAVVATLSAARCGSGAIRSLNAVTDRDVAHRLLKSNCVGTVRVTTGCCRRRSGIEHEGRRRRHRVDRSNRLILLGNSSRDVSRCGKTREPRAQRKARRKDDDAEHESESAEERPQKQCDEKRCGGDEIGSCRHRGEQRIDDGRHRGRRDGVRHSIQRHHTVRRFLRWRRGDFAGRDAMHESIRRIRGGE